LTCLDSVDTNLAGVGTADFVGANFTPHVLIVNAGEVCFFLNDHIVFKSLTMISY